MTNNIILCFDGDSAGEEATTSAIEVLKEIDINPKIIRLEENLDPDEYILKYGESKFKSKLENPESSISFLMKIHRTNKNLTDLNDISKYIDESLKELSNTNDEIVIELTIKKLSKEFDIEYNTLKNKYDNLLKETVKNKPKKISEIKIKPKYDTYDSASRNLIYYMINRIYGYYIKST